MRISAIAILAFTLAGCSNSSGQETSIVGPWSRDNGPGGITIRDGGSVTVRDTTGAKLNGTWKDLGGQAIQLQIDMMGTDTCQYSINGRALQLSGCPYQGGYLRAAGE